MENNKTSWDAFQITENGKGKSLWRKIGIAFENRDRSINVILDALPMNGKVQLRDRRLSKKYNPEQQQGETL